MAAPLEDTICRSLLQGRPPNLVPDLGAEPELRELPAVTEYGVGAGLRPHRADNAGTGRFFLAAPAREARPDLGDDDVRALRSIARRLCTTLDRRAGTCLRDSPERLNIDRLPALPAGEG